jgi:hypothetical protein
MEDFLAAAGGIPRRKGAVVFDARVFQYYKNKILRRSDAARVNLVVRSCSAESRDTSVRDDAPAVLGAAEAIDQKKSCSRGLPSTTKLI